MPLKDEKDAGAKADPKPDAAKADTTAAKADPKPDAVKADAAALMGSTPDKGEKGAASLPGGALVDSLKAPAYQVPQAPADGGKASGSGWSVAAGAFFSISEVRKHSLDVTMSTTVEADLISVPAPPILEEMMRKLAGLPPPAPAAKPATETAAKAATDTAGTKATTDTAGTKAATPATNSSVAASNPTTGDDVLKKYQDAQKAADQAKKAASDADAALKKATEARTKKAGEVAAENDPKKQAALQEALDKAKEEELEAAALKNVLDAESGLAAARAAREAGAVAAQNSKALKERIATAQAAVDTAEADLKAKQDLKKQKEQDKSKQPTTDSQADKDKLQKAVDEAAQAAAAAQTAVDRAKAALSVLQAEKAYLQAQQQARRVGTAVPA